MNKTNLIKKASLTLVKKLAVSSAEHNANSACFWYNHQAKLPTAVKNLRKF